MRLREDGGVKKPKDDGGSFWDNFVSSFESNAKQIGQNVTRTASEFGRNFLVNLGETSVGQDVQDLIVREASGGGQIAKMQAFAETPEGKKWFNNLDKLTSPVLDPLLQAASYIEPAWSYGIARPLSTVAIATDKDSELYKDGFQINDIRKAWNRSAQVSFGQALPKSSIFQGLPSGKVGNYAVSVFGPDVDDVDIWDDKSVQKYYEKNPVGQVFSGSIDAVLNIFGSAKIDAAARSLYKIAGATTQINTVDDLVKLETEAAKHIDFLASAGASGEKTTYGMYVETLANTKNVEEAVNVTQLFSNNLRLPELFVKIDDPKVISDMILADKGYAPAMKRLLETDADVLYTLGDMRTYIMAKYADDPIAPLNAELRQLQDAYDKAIERNPAYKELWDSFMDESGRPRMLGNGWKPTTLKAIEGARLGSIKTRSAISSGNFENANTFIAHTLGSTFAGGPVTVMVKQAMSGLPRGYYRTSPTGGFENVREITAVFDDLRFMRNNTNVLKVEPIRESVKAGAPVEFRTATVAEVRDSFLKRFAAVKPEDMPRFIDQFDDEIARYMAYNLDADIGFVQQVIRDARKNSNQFHVQLRDRGYYFDEAGNRVAFEPAFVRQLADTIPMLPWRDIETAILRAKKTGVAEAASNLGAGTAAAYNIVQRFFSSNILVTRPAYTLKNSVMAPLTDELMHFGRVVSDGGFGASATRFFTNRQRRLQGIVESVKLKMPTSQYKKLSKEINVLAQSYDNALAIRDDAVSEYLLLATGRLSPVVAKNQGKNIVKNLEQMDALVTKIERNLNIIAPGARTGDQVPTLYELYRRVEYIRSNGGAAQAAKLDAKVQSIVAQNLNWTPQTTGKLLDLDVQIQQVIDESQAILQKMGVLKEKQADELLKVLPYKKTDRGYEGTFSFETALGSKVTIDDLYAENAFGEAMRAEMSASVTQQLTMTNEIRLAQNANRYTRLTEHGIVRPSDPEYFEQLAHYANRFVRNDAMGMRILNIGLPKKDGSGQVATFQDVLDWAASKEGKEYFNALGATDKTIRSMLATQLNNVENYFPTATVRQQLLDGEVDAATLQKLIGGDIDRLTPITPTDFDATVALFNQPTTAVNAWIRRNATNIEQKLFQTFATKPEDAVARFPGGAELFRENMMRRINLLEGQNLPIEQYNAIRQAAVRESAEQLKNIFYSVPRQNRAIYATRVLASFPQAFVSGIRRYSKFSIAHPGRALLGLQAYRDTYESFGVDARGNRVPIEEAKYMVLPFSKQVQSFFGVPAATGILLPRNAFNYVLNSPGTSWLVSFGTQALLRNKPDKQEDIEKLLGEVGMQWLSPSGAFEDNPFAVFLSSYQKDLYNFIRSDESNSDWLKAHVQAHKYLFAEWEASGKIGPEPTEEQSRRVAKNWFMQRIMTKFFIGFGAKVDAPGQIGNDIYKSILNKTGNDSEKAREMMEDKFGSWSSWYTISANESNYYIPPTQEAYERVWGANKELAKDLIEIDPELVAVLVADVADEFSSPVYNFLTRKTLPGTDLKIKSVLTPRQAERKKKISDGWREYIENRREIDAVLEQNGMKTMDDSLRAQFNFYVKGEDPDGSMRKRYPDVKTMPELYPEWFDEFRSGYTVKTGFKTAKALDMIINNKDFMSRAGKKPFWFAAKKFMVDREIATRYAKDPNVSLSNLQETWRAYVKDEYGTPGKKLYNKKFYDFFIRYLEEDTLEGL